MGGYSLAAAGGVSVTGAALLRLATSASVRATLLGWSWCGNENNGASTGAQALQLIRSTGGTVSTAQTPQTNDSDSRAPDTAGAIDFSTDPTLSGQPLMASRMVFLSPVSGAPTDYLQQWWAHPRWPIVMAVSAFVTLRADGQTAWIGPRSFFFHEGERSAQRPVRRRGRTRGFFHHCDGALGFTNTTGTPSYNKSAPEFTMLQAETWPESFMPPYSAALFPAAAPALENAVGSVTAWGLYTQNFAPVLAQMALWRAFDAPVADNAVAGVNPRIPSGVTRFVYPFASGDNQIDQAVASVTSHWPYPAWLNRLFGISQHKPVTDLPVAQVPGHWNYPYRHQQPSGITEHEPVSDLPVAAVSTHWPYPIVLKGSPGTPEPKVAVDQAVGSVTSHWSFLSWFKGLFGSPVIDVVIVVQPDDGSVGGANRSWTYGQQFQQPPRANEPTAATDQASATVTSHWPFASWFRQPVGTPVENPVVVIITDGSVGGANLRWSYPQQFQQPPPSSEPTTAQDQAVGSVSSHWSFTSWLNRLFSHKDEPPVTDVAVAQVNIRWPQVPTLSIRAFDLLIGQKLLIQTPSMGAVVFHIAGITRDCSGAALGNCQVLLFRTSDDLLIASTTSDVNGNYSIIVTDNVTQHFLVAYFVDAPDVAGTTRNDVTGN